MPADLTALPAPSPAVSTDQAALRARAEQLLTWLAGPDARLREDQWAAIRALVVERRRVQLVQRTGWGKSAVYWIATALLRERGSGPNLVISPLLALMRDQVAAAARAGLVARTLNSANAEDWPPPSGRCWPARSTCCWSPRSG